MSSLLFLIKRIWTSPNTLLGLAIGFLSVPFGGKVQRRRGCIEFYGGFVRILLEKMPTGSGALALTLGHTILGQTEAALDVTRDHEHVHVRQYEMWGPFFIPAYFAASLLAWLKGEDMYRDNVFEKEAFGETEIR